MIGKKKGRQQSAAQRSPHIVRQQQNTYRYGSSRPQAERPRPRVDASEARDSVAKASRFMRRFIQIQHVLGVVGAIAIVLFLSLLTAPPHIVIRDGASVPVRDVSAYDDKAIELTQSLPNKSKFFIDRQKISDEMLAAFPEVEQADVTTPIFGGAATVKLTVSKPQLLLSSGPDTYVLSTRGLAIINITKDRPEFKTDGLPFITDQSSTPIELGKPALTSVQTAFVTELVHQSTAKQFAIESMTMSAGGGELIVRYANVPYFIKFNLNEDARKSFGTYMATKEYLEVSNTNPAEYIDVRIPERAYVK